jgi:hypothetical protein
MHMATAAVAKAAARACAMMRRRALEEEIYY